MSLSDVIREVEPKSMADMLVFVAIMFFVYLPGITTILFFVDGWRMELLRWWRKRRADEH